MNMEETTAKLHEKQQWVTSPHNRPRCPVHGVRLVAYAGHGPIGWLRCPFVGCEHKERCVREQVKDE